MVRNKKKDKKKIQNTTAATENGQEELDATTNEAEIKPLSNSKEESKTANSAVV